MKTSASGTLAGIVAAIALAPPALGAPANVSVRVEGTGATLVPETRVQTTDEPAGPAGSTCPGTSGFGAMNTATAGDWTGTYFGPGLGWFVEAIKGERHASASEGYWALWINNAYAPLGLCGTEVQEGDALVVVPDADEPILDLTGVPPTATVGQPVSVDVHAYGVTLDAEYNPIPFDEPAAGATVTAGGTTATVGVDGRAQLVFPAAGPVSVQATQPGHVRSAARRVDVVAPAPGKPPPPAPAADTTAPVAAFASALADGRVFSRRKAPRELSGTVEADPSGLRSVRLSIRRQVGKRCWTFRDTTERFKRHKCGGKWYFRIGDRAEWSYLLPRKLPTGRYTIGVMAVDKAFNESRSEVGIRVR